MHTPRPATTRLAPCFAAFTLLCATALPLLAATQPAAPPAPAAEASAASQPQPSGPRLLTPAEKRDNANAAAAPDLRPDRPVVPQIVLPLGRKPPAANAPASRPAGSTASTVPGHIGDAAARCEALAAEQERATCRKRAAQGRLPN